jgi:A1 cistron-splicing factor AAR2
MKKKKQKDKGGIDVEKKRQAKMAGFQPTPTILLPHLPAKTLVGLDLLSFTSPEQFYGISDLSPGWHFLYTGTTENFSLRCGAWFYVGDISQAEFATRRNQLNDATAAAGQEIIRSQSQDPTEVRIWKWNSNIEAAVPLMSDTDSNRLEIMRWKANLGGLRQMGALFSYKSAAAHEADEQDEKGTEGNFPRQQDWARLTNHLSPQILSRILGEARLDDDARPSWTVSSANSAARDAEVIPGLTAQESSKETGNFGSGENEKELRFLPVDLKRTWREGAIGRERTEAAQDRSWALGDLISRHTEEQSSTAADQKAGESHILGELQFCFLMILTLMNYSCLEQWKRLLGLIFTCRSAIRERESFFRDVLQLLLLQLRHCEDVVGGLFQMDGDYDGNFLRKLLTNFRQFMDQALDDGAGSLVKRDMDALEQWVRENYGWELRKTSIMRRGLVQLEDGEEVELAMLGADEDDETGEYAPVIVDTGEGDRTAIDAEDNDMSTPVN